MGSTGGGVVCIASVSPSDPPLPCPAVAALVIQGTPLTHA